VNLVGNTSGGRQFFTYTPSLYPIARKGLSFWLSPALRLLPVALSFALEKAVHFVTAIHQLAWMEHPAIWLCESCAILWLALRAVRSPLVRTGVLLMLCGLGMNALVTDTNAGSMPVIGMPSTVRPASPMWHGATLETRLPLLADQARLGLFSIGDIALLSGGMLIVVICLRRALERTRQPGWKKLTELILARQSAAHR
jgi:hypothetical protein